MKTEYVQDLNARYLVLENEAPYQEDYRYYMLLSNHIFGMLPCSLRCMDKSLRFYYEIGEMESLEAWCTHNRPDKRLLVDLLQAVWRLEEECRAYLLCMDNILLDPQYIFVEQGKFWFCYLPVYEECPEQGFRSLVKRMAEQDDGKDREYTDLLCVLLQRIERPFVLQAVMTDLCGAGRADRGIGTEGGIGNVHVLADDDLRSLFDGNTAFADGRQRFRSLQDALFDTESLQNIYGDDRDILMQSADTTHPRVFSADWRRRKKSRREQKQADKARLKEEKRLEKDARRQEKKEAALRQQEERLREKEERLREKRASLEDQKRQEEMLNMEEDPPTTFLYQEDRPHRLTLTSADGSDRMIIDESPYYIGSDDSGYVQGYIANPVVSKRHAQIVELSGLWFLEDLRSTNGSCHNGHHLDAGERVRLVPGDKLLFANLEYRVSATRADM